MGKFAASNIQKLKVLQLQGLRLLTPSESPDEGLDLPLDPAEGSAPRPSLQANASALAMGHDCEPPQILQATTDTASIDLLNNYKQGNVQ